MKYSFVDVFWGDLAGRLDPPPYVPLNSPPAKENIKNAQLITAYLNLQGARID